MSLLFQSDERHFSLSQNVEKAMQSKLVMEKLRKKSGQGVILTSHLHPVPMKKLYLYSLYMLSLLSK
jgi:hypothetical protein